MGRYHRHFIYYQNTLIQLLNVLLLLGKLCESRWPLYLVVILPTVAVLGIVIGILWYIKTKFTKDKEESTSLNPDKN